MRIAELSRVTGVPVPTIKYYLREGLLPPGEHTLPNQAQYDEHHVRRLRLARALVEIGGLSVASAREVIERMTAPGIDLLHALGKAQYATIPHRDHPDDPALAAALSEIDALIARHGWQIGDNPARLAAAQALLTLRRLGQPDAPDLLRRYAETAQHLASAEVDLVLDANGHPADRTEELAERVVVWTLLGDSLLAAFRRMAQEHIAAERFRNSAN